MFNYRISARDLWIALSMAVVGFTAGYGSYRGIMEAANMDKVPKGSYVLKDDLEREYVRRDALTDDWVSQSVVETDYIPRSECSRLSSDSQIAQANRATSTTDPPRAQAATRRTGEDHGPSTSDSSKLKNLSMATDSYRLTLLSARKQLDKITLVIDLRSIADETVGFSFFLGPYLLDEKGERWDYESDTSSLVSYRPVLKLPLGSHVRAQIRFRSRGSTSGKTFTFLGTEGFPVKGRSIIFNDIRIQ